MQECFLLSTFLSTNSTLFLHGNSMYHAKRLAVRRETWLDMESAQILSISSQWEIFIKLSLSKILYKTEEPFSCLIKHRNNVVTGNIKYSQGNVLTIKTCLDSFISLTFHGHQRSRTAWHFWTLLSELWNFAANVLTWVLPHTSSPWILSLREWLPLSDVHQSIILSAFKCHTVVLDSSSSAFHGCGFQSYLLLLFSIMLSSCQQF